MLKKCCDYLEDWGLKIAFVESASAGYLSSQFALYKNSGAKILLGGIVCYDPSVKEHVLNISKDLIQQHTAESLVITQVMAHAGSRLFPLADVVVACTGLLKPGGSATLDKPEGTFFVSIYHQGQITSQQYYFKHSPSLRLNSLILAVCQQLLSVLQKENLVTSSKLF